MPLTTVPLTTMGLVTSPLAGTDETCSVTTGLVALGHSDTRVEHASQELAVPALVLRAPTLLVDELVHIYVPHEPTVAFTARDLRSPSIGRAVAVAQELGFAPVVRSPGGRMVAYDSGSVIIDHVDRNAGLQAAGPQSFEATAKVHTAVLSGIGVPDVRVGQVAGEYCPGEFSVNLAGAVKVVGGAQRVTPRGALFSTVVQVEMAERVREAIIQVSAALGYELRPSTIGGVSDVTSGVTPAALAAAFHQDYQDRLGLRPGVLPPDLVAMARSAITADGLFHVDNWVRALVR